MKFKISDILIAKCNYTAYRGSLRCFSKDDSCEVVAFNEEILDLKRIHLRVGVRIVEFYGDPAEYFYSKVELRKKKLEKLNEKGR